VYRDAHRWLIPAARLWNFRSSRIQPQPTIAPHSRMDSLLDLIHRIRDVRAIIAWGGYVGLTTIIFAETGLLIGFFLPGDSLLVTAGLLAATTGVFNVFGLGLLLTVASILGNTVGYGIGRAPGPRLFSREDSLLFNKKHLYRAHEFYEKKGGITVIIARFMPIVRTFVPFVAGVGKMSVTRFGIFNLIGGAAWVYLLTYLGFFFGGTEIVRKNFILLVVAIIVISVLPIAVEMIRGWLESRRAARGVAGAGTK
jgi:membrane-associated protein